ncbi:MAG: hypothetical protein HC916_22330 [Coleofasciculaceae cyanobacterium SM2_1_6]|nr:hypothetical protein [Coleofasciculaceae cyanobacterium SM2_1_6]
MMVIPAIDILDGKCVRLYQGDYAISEVFNDDPVAVAQQWADQGATRLHLVDLDGAKQGRVVNGKIIAAIGDRVKIPIQVGGGLRDWRSVTQVLGLGVTQVILGTAAVKQPELVGQLCGEFPGQILVGIDARNGKVATDGWLETSEVVATTLGQTMANLGAAGIIYTDIHRDGTLSGANIPALREMAEAIDLPDLGIALGLLIAAAGVALWQQTGLVWLVLSTTSRTIAQIIVFSYLLAIVFALRTPLATGLALAGLISVSAIVLTNRVPQKQRSWLPLTGVILATTTLTTTGYAVLLVIRPVDWYDPQYWLPIGWF